VNAGFASIDITPSEPCVLDGFFARPEPSEGVGCPLFARALWLEDRETKALVVALDWIGLTPQWAKRLLLGLAKQLSIPKDNIILSTTHTHAAPRTVHLRGLGPINEAYLEMSESKILEAAERAARASEPVQVSWAESPFTGFSVNRRVHVGGRRTELRANPLAPADRAVHVLSLRGAAQRIVLFTHACHPYFQKEFHRLINSDFCGHACVELERRGISPVFIQGCAADIMPDTESYGPDQAAAAGVRLADAVANALGATASASAVSDDLQVASRWIDLPHDRATFEEAAELGLGAASIAARIKPGVDAPADARYAQAMSEWLAALRAARRADGSLPPIPVRASLLRIGAGAIVLLPNEIFFETGQQLAQEISATPTFVAAYCHGFYGYVPPAHAHREGGYEVDVAHRYLGLRRTAPNATDVMREKVVALWSHMKGTNRE
jgi:hypothetical protein